MTNPDRSELVKLADRLAFLSNVGFGYDIIDTDRSILRKSATALRRLASSDGGVKGEPEPVALIHMAVIDDGELRMMSGRRPVNCELYAMPDYGKAPKLYTAPPADAGMREALEPFAKEADNWADSVSDDHRSLCTEPGSTTAHPGSETAFTVGDLRRAKAALTAPVATTKPDGGEQPNATTIAAIEELKRGGGEIGTGYGEYTPVTVRGSTSDPSSTRSDVPALTAIAAERQRQRDVEGWTHEHDDGHSKGELAAAAACYAMGRCIVEGSLRIAERGLTKNLWPWSLKWWKPKDRRRDLVKAGALIVAEIERLDRLDQFEIRRKK